MATITQQGSIDSEISKRQKLLAMYMNCLLLSYSRMHATGMKATILLKLTLNGKPHNAVIFSGSIETKSITRKICKHIKTIHGILLYDITLDSVNFN